MSETNIPRAGGPVRVFLVHQSPLVMVALEKILSGVPGLEVVGSARHGGQALPLIERLWPDVICLETEMPVMDGLALTQSVMSRFPTPILVLETEARQGEAATVAEIIEAGALDHFLLPRDSTVLEARKNDFTAKVRRLSRVPVISRPAPPRQTAETAAALAAPRAPRGQPASEGAAGQGPAEIVAMGASTGGPQALLAILSQLPGDYPRAILCVQHISKGFLEGLVDWLNSQCALTVKIARAGEIPLAGHVYFAEDDHHLELDARGRIWLAQTPAISGHRPAVTVLFESVARRLGARATGILLTGMGTDGALGLKAMARAGALTIVQDEVSCVVFGMPRQAIALGAARLILSPPEIARKMLAL